MSIATTQAPATVQAVPNQGAVQPIAGTPPPATISFPRGSRWRDLTPQFPGTIPWSATAPGGISSLVMPPMGYMDYLELTFAIISTGNAATVALSADAPWNLISSIGVSDVNGFPVFGPVNGYDLYLVNKYGGYSWAPDPRGLSSYAPLLVGTGATAGSGAFTLRIPFAESQRDFFCALPNQDAQAGYKLDVTFAPPTTVFSTPPGGTLSLVVSGYLRCRSIPPAADQNKTPIAQAPVGVILPNAQYPQGAASTQYWTKEVVATNPGTQTIRSTRAGNVIRKIIFVLRQAASGARDEADFPVPAQWVLNNNPERSYSTSSSWKDEMTRSFGYDGTLDGATGLDSGVRVLDYQNQLGHPSPAELRDFWLPTRQGNLLQLIGSVGSGASSYSMTILTNDVAPAPGAPVGIVGA